MKRVRKRDGGAHNHLARLGHAKAAFFKIIQGLLKQSVRLFFGAFSQLHESMARLFPDRKAPGRNLVKDTLSSFKTHADCWIISFKAPCVQSKPKSSRRAQFKPKLRSLVLVDQSAFSAAKRAQLSRNYFVQLV